MCPKNKMDTLSEIFTLLILVSGVFCEPHLALLQNLNDYETTKYYTIIEGKSGTNTFITCKLLNGIKEFSETIWVKPKDSKYSTEYGPDDGHFPDITLQFNQLSKTNEGIYLCNNPKHKFLKIVRILTKDGFGKYKRSINNYEEYTNNESHSDDYYYHHNYDTTQDFKPVYITIKFFYVIVGGLGVFVLVYAIMKCCHDNDNVNFSRYNAHHDLPPTYQESVLNSRAVSLHNLHDTIESALPTYEIALENIVSATPLLHQDTAVVVIETNREE